MIKISGSVQRNFIFPAPPKDAFAFYTDFHRILNMIPHISILEQYGEGQYRMLYSTTELGIYRVRILCNIEADLAPTQGIMRIVPLEGEKIIKSNLGVYSLSTQGKYSSTSIFKPVKDEANQDKTEIDYQLNIQAELPIPLGLRFMPSKLINEIAQSITQWRITEIANGFIERSLLAFGSPH